jgi:hypothetical protein
MSEKKEEKEGRQERTAAATKEEEETDKAECFADTRIYLNFVLYHSF